MSTDEHEPARPLLKFRVVRDETNPFLALIEISTATGTQQLIVTTKALEEIAIECHEAAVLMRGGE